jgi:peroxiredoxin
MNHLGVAIFGLLLAAAPQPPSIGQPVPDFTAVDETGAEHRLSQYRGQAVVLEWTNPDCPFVARHYEADTMEKLAKALGAKDVVWLAVNSTHSNTPADTGTWKAEQGFAYPTLQDAT